MKALAYITIFLLACTILIGCKAKIKYVPVETIRTEYRDKYLRDSIHVYDSIHITDKGDTLIETRYRYIFIDKLRTDTLIQRDTISVPIEVERPLSKWENMKMEAGGWAIGVLSGVLVFFIVWLVFWLIRKFK